MAGLHAVEVDEAVAVAGRDEAFHLAFTADEADLRGRPEDQVLINNSAHFTVSLETTLPNVSVINVYACVSFLFHSVLFAFEE